MKSIIRWAIGNEPAMNMLMVATLIVGAVSLWSMRREVFPEFALEIILVTVPYPGASPEEVEEGVCQKIEEAVRSIAGIKKQTAVAQEGSGFLILELDTNVPDVQTVLGEVRSEIDRIRFPELAEDPEVKQITLRQPAVQIGIIGRDTGDDIFTAAAELKLREVAEQVRDELLQLPTVSQANILGTRDYQIDVEISEDTLRKYGLTLQQVAQIIRRENLELPGGTMKTESQDVLLRGKNKRLVGGEIEKIPLVTQPGGVVLTVGDLGVVRDEFADTTAISRIDDRPGLVISVDRTTDEDLLSLVADVKKYAAAKRLDGYELRTWADRSVDVRDRIHMLVKNGLTGLVLVFLVLAVFLELRLAFWVALGIPIAVLGAGAVLLFGGQTLNMLSMFAFLMALGIVVDDAIVIGENIYMHRQMGKNFTQAAVDGACEVLPSVAASVATTIIAFVPLMFVSGVMGKFIAVLPVAVIAMLVISLIESTFVLPCHLAHRDGILFFVLRQVLYPLRWLGGVFHWLNDAATRLLEVTIERYYLPWLRWSLKNPAIILCSAAALLMVSVGFVRAGIIPWQVFPKIDNPTIEAKITYPDGTPSAITDKATQRIEAAIQQINEQYAEQGSPLVVVSHRMVGQITSPSSVRPDARTDGANLGSVSVELVEASQRRLASQQIIDLWRKQAGEFPGVESVTFGSPSFGPAGTPIEFKLLTDGKRVRELEQAVEECKAKLSQYPGVFDIADDSRPGKWEFQLKIKDKALAMGIPLADLAETVRASYYGEEVMRLQRGRHEVKLMVRYPREDRRSLANFEDIRVRTGDGAQRPLTELAEVTVQRGYSEINRVDQLRSITISADVDDAVGNARNIVHDLQTGFMPELLAKHPGLSVRWEGQQEQTNESVRSMLFGFLIAMLAMYVLLTIEFRSYFQPIIVLAIIPFGAIGAIAGHALLGLPLTMFSLFGLVALTGVVVNDSIVLIDFINKHIAESATLEEALLEAGRRRFRPVMLTSVTTIAGLLPMLMETSFQAQILIPMATSLCFGLLLATVLVLVLVPTLYYVYVSIFRRDIAFETPHSGFLEEHQQEHRQRNLVEG
jgi:HAE1 family hydrophobic/amphiphilic exporter-1